jgi:hypothetical protein
MRNLTSALLLCFMIGAAAAAHAQTAPKPSVPPDISVLESKWNWGTLNPALDEDPFRANDQYREDVRNKKEMNRVNQQAARAGVNAVYSRPRKLVYEEVPTGPQVNYTYTAKVRNTGAKTVQAIVWTYVFFNLDTQKEVGRHQHTSKEKIRPGKSQNLTGRSASPPVQIIDARKAGSSSSDRIEERIVIQRIEYTDGSVWQQPSK